MSNGTELLIKEIHRAIWGIPGTEDKGIYGELKELNKLCKEQNNKVNTNSGSINKLKGFLIGASLAAGSGLGVGLFNIFN